MSVMQILRSSKYYFLIALVIVTIWFFVKMIVYQLFVLLKILL